MIATTIDGQTCVFPFTVGGTTYSKCTAETRDRPWCPITADFATDQMWAYCESEYSLILLYVPLLSLAIHYYLLFALNYCIVKC